MFAITGLKKRNSFALVDTDANGAGVLPGYLRKPMRFLGRLVRGDVDVPKHAGLLSLALLFGSTGIYGMILGGHTPVVLKETTSRLGFAIGQIKVTGHTETSEIDVLEQLQLDGATSLIGFDSEAARQRILLMPWIASAKVTKLYPDGVLVQLTEKQPFAVWQHEDALSLIEENGKEIIAFDDEKYLGLPLLIGEHANAKAKDVLATMSAFPGLASRVKSYLYVGGRRWDLRLDDGVTIQLPEKNLHAALEATVRLEKDHGLLARDIQVVDLRIDDRIVVRMTPDAQLTRDATIKEFDSKKKKAEAHI